MLPQESRREEGQRGSGGGETPLMLRCGHRFEHGRVNIECRCGAWIRHMDERRRVDPSGKEQSGFAG